MSKRKSDSGAEQVAQELHDIFHRRAPTITGEFTIERFGGDNFTALIAMAIGASSGNPELNATMYAAATTMPVAQAVHFFAGFMLRFGYMAAVDDILTEKVVF